VAQFSAAMMDAAMAAEGSYLIEIDMEYYAGMEISVMLKRSAELYIKGCR